MKNFLSYENCFSGLYINILDELLSFTHNELYNISPLSSFDYLMYIYEIYPNLISKHLNLEDIISKSHTLVKKLRFVYEEKLEKISSDGHQLNVINYHDYVKRIRTNTLQDTKQMPYIKI